MKKKIGFLTVVIIVLGITWLILANKFDDKVRTVYLPILQDHKKKGIIELELHNIKIHKYKFSISITNCVILPKSDIFQTKLDGVLLYYNPLTQDVRVSSFGDKISIGTGKTEIYIANPSFSIKIGGSIFEGHMNDIHITFNSAPKQFLKSDNQLPLISDKGTSYKITGKLDNKTSQYLLKLTTNTKGISITHDYLKWSNHFTNKNFKIIQESQLLKDFFNDITTEYYYTTVTSHLIDSHMNVSIAANKNHLENIFKFIQGKIHFEELVSNLSQTFNLNKELFNIAIISSYGNHLFNNTLSFNLASDGQVLQGNLDIEDSKNYPKDMIEEMTKLTAEFLDEIFNKITKKNLIKSKKLTLEDFMDLANSLIDIKNTKIRSNFTYRIEDSITDANLHFGLNEYSIDLSINNKEKERYNGMLILSDPLNIINTTTKFVHEIVLPLIEKISDDNKSAVYIMQKYISNIDDNAFKALMVFNKIPELTKGHKFETDFSYEPKSFSLKINNQSFWEIITNKKIVKFLRGFDNEEDNKELPEAKVLNGEQYKLEVTNKKMKPSSINNNNNQDHPNP